MGIVTVGTEIIRSLASPRKVPGSLSVDARLPVFENVAVAFSAEPIAFGKVDKFPIVKSQPISFCRIMAIEAPSHCFRMMQLDLGMFFL